MALYIHLYRDKAGNIAEQVGIAHSEDEAFQWLDDWNNGFVRSGCEYETTQVILDTIADASLSRRRNMLYELDDWREERKREARIEARHQFVTSLRVA